MIAVPLVFDDPDSTTEAIIRAVCTYVLCWYCVKKKQNLLSEFRYISFVASAVKNFLFLVSLPPTVDALKHHALRCFYQIQKWRGNDIPSIRWGWQMNNSSLVPTQM